MKRHDKLADTLPVGTLGILGAGEQPRHGQTSKRLYR